MNKERKNKQNVKEVKLEDKLSPDDDYRLGYIFMLSLQPVPRA